MIEKQVLYYSHTQMIGSYHLVNTERGMDRTDSLFLLFLCQILTRFSLRPQ